MARFYSGMLLSLGWYCQSHVAAAQQAPTRPAPEPAAWLSLGPSARVIEEPRQQYVGLLESARSVPFESLGLIALITYTGFKDWNWGSASFRFNSEGWFAMNTGSGGLDKVGHAYATYMVSELLYWRLRSTHYDHAVVSFYPALFGTLL